MLVILVIAAWFAVSPVAGVLIGKALKALGRGDRDA